jgi:hypothetical protein
MPTNGSANPGCVSGRSIHLSQPVLRILQREGRRAVLPLNPQADGAPFDAVWFEHQTTAKFPVCQRVSGPLHPPAIPPAAVPTFLNNSIKQVLFSYGSGRSMPGVY